jgi:hypothetical protein
MSYDNNSIEFVPGLIVKQRAENAPDYVICKLSIKPRELAEWLQSKDQEWVNVEVKIAKSGKPYAAVDPWKPQGTARPAAPAAPRAAPSRPPSAPAPSSFDDMDDDIPFASPHMEHDPMLGNRKAKRAQVAR